MRITVRVLTILVMVFLPRISIAQTAGGKPSAITPLWLAGCWEVTAGELVIEEHWMAVRGGTLLGPPRHRGPFACVPSTATSASPRTGVLRLPGLASEWTVDVAHGPG